jgi:sirohydrochlorin ferrochelatase
MRVCFAAMAEPLLDNCLTQLADQRSAELAQIRQIVVQPHLLFAGELLCGIRQAAARFSSRVPQWEWRITEHLGCDDRLVQAIVERAISAAGDWISSTPALDRSVNRQ